ncbi:NAD(P)-binding protein [Favolaschia claudopus]|uniref:NAD(P)-binding protein n=1 Tax=Favolaschia claudopus TaxID=2862362 RepID=A0AAW0DLB6_9AGAR
MSSVRNARVLFNSHPESYPIPGETIVYDTTKTIDLQSIPLNGGFLIKTLVLSVDPFLRYRMNPGVDDHMGSFRIGAPLDGFGIGVVLRSETPEVQAGESLNNSIWTVFQEYTVYPALGELQILKKHPKLPLSVYLGAAGMPGQTAYLGWKAYADAKPGEVAFVTTGAGAVGSIVIQLAKQAGMKVIASAGSEEKVEFMRSLGADVAFNYKTTDTRKILEKEGPINVFWDHIGGEITDAGIEFAADGARILSVGYISGLNSSTGWPQIKKFHLVGLKSLHIHGILVTPLLEIPGYLEEFYEVMPRKLVSGEIKYVEDLTMGLDQVGEVMLAVLKGTNKGKAVVVVAEE